MAPTAFIRSPRRLIMPVVCILLALTGWTWVWLRESLERNLSAWISTAIALLLAALLFIWAVLFSGWAGRTRLILLGAVVVLGGLGALTLKKVGSVSGTGLPRFGWKWSKHTELAAPAAAEAAAVTPVQALDFPEFLGPGRKQVIEGVKLARDWAARPPREVWRHPVGLGWSGFVVSGGRALTQEQRGDQELVTCYDLATGKLLWSSGHTTRFVEWQGGDGPRATPTITPDGKVFAYGANGALDCLDLATGARLWTREILGDLQLGNQTWGKSSSPLVYDGLVVVTGGRSATLVACDRATGAILWKSGGSAPSYATPVLATLADTRQLISFNAASLSGHDPATGVVLWSQDWGSDKMPKAAQPVLLDGDRLFISAGYGMGCTLFQFKPGAPGQPPAITELWHNMKLKMQFNNASLRGGLLYGLDDGQLACLDPATGDRLWKEGRYGSGQSLMVGDLTLVQAEPGFVALCETTPQSVKELARLPALSSKTWNNPCLAAPYLLVRNDQEAVCYELPLEP